MVALPTGVVNTFTYNADGQRVQKQDSTGTTNHIWDERNILLETNGSNVTQVVYTLEPEGYGNLISQSRTGTDSFYLFDALGSTRQLAGNSGLASENFTLDSFGNLLSGTPTATPFIFGGISGYYVDSDVLLDYIRSRYYSPAVGRFLSRDTSESRESQLYAYMANDPTSGLDPSGQQPKPKGCAIRIGVNPIILHVPGIGPVIIGGHISIILDVNGKPVLFQANPGKPQPGCPVNSSFWASRLRLSISLVSIPRAQAKSPWDPYQSRYQIATRWRCRNVSKLLRRRLTVAALNTMPSQLPRSMEDPTATRMRSGFSVRAFRAVLRPPGNFQSNHHHSRAGNKACLHACNRNAPGPVVLK